MNLGINNKLILFISLTFSLLVGSKFYGFGRDYYHAYFKPNLDWGRWYDFLGYRVSTFTVYDINFGVYIVSFLLSISCGILLKQFFKFKGLNSVIFFILIYVMTLHTWPIIMSTSNAMRQGIVMSLIFISFSYLMEKKLFIPFLIILISVFFHKSGIIYFIIYVNVLIIKFISNFLKTNKYIIYFYILYGLVISFFIYYLLLFVDKVDIGYSKIIEKDYRFHFVAISLIYVLIFSYKFKLLKTDTVSLFLYLFTFAISSVLMLGLNWEYERFMMMMTLPYIFMFTIFLNKNSSYIYYFVSIGSLLLLTVLNGMYSSFQ